MSFHIPAPAFTQTPNDLFDKWLPSFREVDLKVLLVIMRKTFGWHKKRDRISISQLAKITGCTEQSVVKAVRGLIEKKLIRKQVIGKNGMQQTFYEMVVDDECAEDSNNSDPCEKNRGTPVKLTGTKETLSKERKSLLRDQQKPEEKTPAAGNNNFSAKKQEKKIYPCLEELDIFAHTKKSITAQHTEEQVQYATQLLTHKDSIYHGKGTKESSMLIQHALQDPQRYKDTIDNLGQPKLTKQKRDAKEREITQSDNKSRKEANRKWVKTQSGFEHGKTYSLWKCEIKDDAIWFSKKNGWSACVHYIEKDFMKLLDEHLKHLDIAIPNM